MILILFLGSPQRLPSSLGLFYIAITISAGQILLLNDMYIAYRLSELLAVMLVVVYVISARDSTAIPTPQRAGRMSQGLVFAMILVVAANSGWVAGSILYRHVEVLNYLPVWLWRGTAAAEGQAEGGSRMGFSDSGRLSSVLMIKGDQDQTPALNITCGGSPGYLRARAFDVYRQSQWYEAPYQEALFPEQNTPFGMYLVGGRNLFRLRNPADADYEQMTIRHESVLADAIFSPLGACYIEAPFNYMQRDENDIIYAPGSRPGLNYRIAYTKPAYSKTPDRAQRRRLLDVPRDLDPRIGRLAGKIFAGCNTTSEKIDAVIRHFRDNYTYFPGLDAPAESDKLTYFLLDATSGYCEYFASGAAILLRLADVPTRYVTGFLVIKKGSAADSWVARNMDAHAWVEAWDGEKNQWSIVEATVGQSLAAASLDEQAEGAGEGSGVLFGRLVQALYEYGLFGVLGWLFGSYGLRAGIILMAIFLAAALTVKLSQRYAAKKSPSRKLPAAAISPARAALHKMLAKMDRRVKAAGARREPGETLHVFSGRLRRREAGDGLWTKISDWYLEYARLRYRGNVSSVNLEQLSRRVRSLRDFL
jgi:hypothetical protein